MNVIIVIIRIMNKVLFNYLTQKRILTSELVVNHFCTRLLTAVLAVLYRESRVLLPCLEGPSDGCTVRCPAEPSSLSAPTLRRARARSRSTEERGSKVSRSVWDVAKRSHFMLKVATICDILNTSVSSTIGTVDVYGICLLSIFNSEYTVHALQVFISLELSWTFLE